MKLPVLQLVLTFCAVFFAHAERTSYKVDGTWRYSADGPKPGAVQEALPDLQFKDTIQLPGTTDTNAKGPENTERWTGGLTRLHRLVGPAWYEREITIPQSARGKRFTLFLERTKYTQVWLDGKPCGTNAILCTPQEYALGLLEPGQHRLTIVVDNARKPVDVEAHQFSENTQGNWNGILGRMELQAVDPVYLAEVQVYPDVAKKSVRVKTRIVNASGTPGNGSLEISGRSGTSEKRVTIPVAWDAQGATVETELPFGRAAQLWDEFHPRVSSLVVKLQSPSGTEARSVTFGLREFKTKGSQFTINGLTTFLRGKHDGCVFPLTGHPPMDVEGWKTYLEICRQYGINHIRCHTWTPPEAAFAAADMLGMYLQPELPFWGNYNEENKGILMAEALRILKVYGNHPSFVMLSLGNEGFGSREVMGSMIRELRSNDPRHLYAQGSNNHFSNPKLAETDDYWTTGRTTTLAGLQNVRASFATVDGGNGHVQIGPPCTTNTYSAGIEGIPVPVIGHEIAQYTVYPDFKEIPKYTGVFRARNFEHFRDKLAAAGMLDQSDDFFRSSGKLTALCYREEVEAALRTPGFGGFQLLDLQDFPGQGTALIGLLNAFMESKGAITPEEWREFCAPIVPLACFDRYTWTEGETFSAEIEIAHYGEADLNGTTVEWSLSNQKGGIVAKGKIKAGDLKQGGLRKAGRLSIPLAKIVAPAQLTLELRLKGTSSVNHYPLWIYPAQIDTSVPKDVTMSRSFDAATRDVLAKGGRVVLIPESGRLGKSVGGGFTTDFWCWPMFHNKPGTMGLLCDAKHPALAGFPTAFYTDWQWFHLVMNSQPIILDDSPKGLHPLIQVVDNLDRNHKLGLVFEAKVGAGRLLVCATDLVQMSNRPEARQLLRSLLNYAASDAFAPAFSLEIADLKKMLSSLLPVKAASASSAESERYVPANAVDHDVGTRWCAKGASADQWFQMDLGETRTICGCQITWESGRAGYAYVLESSTDGASWTTLSDQQKNKIEGSHQLEFPAVKARFVRVRITGLPQGQWASIFEIGVIGQE